MPELGVVVYVDPRHATASAGLLPFLQGQRLDRSRFAVVIADNAHDPGLALAVQQCRAADPGFALRHLHVDPPGRAAALNAAIRSLDCKYVWLVADDARPASGAAQAFLDFHAHICNPLAAAIGAMVFGAEFRADGFRRWLEDSGDLLGISFTRRHACWPSHFFYAGNACVRRDLFERTGWFDERFKGLAGDDYEFGLRWHAEGGFSQLLAQAPALHEHWLTLQERAGVMTDAGAAACIHEKVIGAQSAPWHRILDRARRDRDRRLPEDDPTLPLPARVPVFQARLAAAFLSGYEAEVERAR